MNEKRTNMIYFIIAALLCVAAITFILLSMFVITDKNWPLTAGLACSAIASFLNAWRWKKVKEIKN